MARIAVIGGGTAGIAASINLADAGHKIYLISDTPFIGGTLPQLDKQFPNDACGFCQLYSRTDRMDTELCLKRNLGIDNVELIRNAEVLSISEDRKRIRLKKGPEYVDASLCTSCGKCEEVCPLEKVSEFNLLSRRKAIYTPYPFAVPNTYHIDDTLCDKCGKCVEVCPTGAINLKAEPEEFEIEVDEVVITTGFKPFDPSPLSEFGYGRFKNVITSIELERLISQFGPTLGELRRPSDGNMPEKIGIIHCIGSRDREHPYCSSACCMYAIKEARMLKEIAPELDITLFYMDIRDFGKRYFLYRKEIEGSVKFIRSRPGLIEENPHNRNLVLYYEDETGEMKNEEFDMVILSVGQEADGTARLAKRLGLKTLHGFIETEVLHPFRAGGYFVAGAAGGPRDIPDTVVEAWAASGMIEISQGVEYEDEELPEINYGVKPAVVISHMGMDIKFNSDRIEEEIRRHGGIYREIDFITTPEGIEELVSFIDKEKPDRLVILGPSVFSNETLIKKRLKALGWHPAQISVLQLNDSSGDITDEIIDNAVSEIERIKYIEFPGEAQLLPQRRVVVIGAGPAGMETSLALSRAGIHVTLVEKSKNLGGNGLKLKRTLEGGDVATYVKEMIERVEKDEKIKVLKEAEPVEVSGWAGDFNVKIKYQDGVISERAGAIVLATGAEEYRPAEKEFGYGTWDRVVTLKEFERLIEEGKVKEGEDVIFIQCVGSRNEEHPYCSRVCCRAAVKNSLNLVEKGVNVTVLARDVMTWGFAELYYRKAREKGVLFIHYNEKRPPVVEDGRVRVYDRIMGKELIFEPDWIVLSAGISPNPDNEKIAKILGIPLEEDTDFFKEANVKFRPVETQKEGIYVVGLARGPRRFPESISDAYAAVSRIVPLLNKKLMKSRVYVSKTSVRRCSICGICVDVCPSGARVLDMKERYARVNEAICQGCGICTTACPSGAAYLVVMNRKQVFSIVDNIL